MKTLREWRLSQLLSMRHLGERSGVAPSTILDIENGRRIPNLATMRKLCDALGIAPQHVTEFVGAIEVRSKDAA
jgi:transcriptional regulator with XRE-family HTH domain